MEIGSGVAWTAQIYDKKERVLFSAENHGRGGCNLYKVDGAKLSESNRYIQELENEAKSAIGHLMWGHVEALDMIMAYFEPGADINAVIQQILKDCTPQE